MARIVRLFVDHPLAPGATCPLDEAQAHYLFGVMRLGRGDRIAVFDGQSGEWTAEIAEAGKRRGLLLVTGQTAPMRLPPDLWLCFAPVVKARTDFIVEKAVEMGARRILPVLTEFTQGGAVRLDRLQAHAVEAAEQCGAVFVPEVAAPLALGDLVAGWPADRRLMVCDEGLAGQALGLPGRDEGAGPWGILVGPAGGFSEAERRRLAALPLAVRVALGPRILRADTAAVAAMTLWQLRLGDWDAA